MAHDIIAPWAERVEGAGSMSADDLFALGEDTSHGYELVDGVLVRMSPTGFQHGEIVFALGFALNAYVKLRKLGKVMAAETGYILSLPGQPDTVLAPDVSYVRAERVPARDDPNIAKFQRLAPDLVAEVASPDQFKPELAAKARLYLDAGVRLVWIVWPATQTVDVWRPGLDAPVATLASGEALDGLDVVPGFAHPAADLFE
jgi:Uma2 family endonuclease